MVSGVGSAALKGSVGTAAFGRAARLGFDLAHPGDGFSRHHPGVSVGMIEVVASFAKGCLMG
jgi:hypothetical protein